MQKQLFIFIVLALLAAKALAFSYTSCLAESQAAPYDMSVVAAASVCDAKTRSGGRGKVGNVLHSLSPPGSTLSAADFARNFDEYLNKANLRTAICYDGCTYKKVTMQTRRCSGYSPRCKDWVTREVSTYVPQCPSGYELLPNTLGNLTRAHTSQLHGPHDPMRTALCRKI